MVAGAQQPPQAADQKQSIVETLRQAAPDAVPLFESATQALSEDKNVEAAELFAKVLARAPKFTPAMRLRAEALYAAGKRMDGVMQIEKAVLTERTAPNLYVFARITAMCADDAQLTEDYRTSELAGALEAAKEANRLLQTRTTIRTILF